MKKRALITLNIILAAVLILALCATAVLERRQQNLQNRETQPPQTTPSAGTATAPSTVPSTPTEPKPTETLPVPTEPTAEEFVLTFVGDCTLGTDPNWIYDELNFVKVIGENYDYPFMNVVEYFRQDDCTFANLETVLADSGTPAEKRFRFRGPTAYTNILTGSSVEAVTIANNHSWDFGQEGYDSTKAALTAAGVHFAEDASSVLITTQRGLKVGLYSVYKAMDYNDMVQEVAALRAAGADIIVASQHHGIEGSHHLTEQQISYAHMFIDAGVDIVWGHHPHVLQKIETYKNGIIYYSLGNFSFGGNHNPKDKDTAVLQQKIIREPDGTVHLGDLEVIPCSVSSAKWHNDFRPTPYEEGSAEYMRVLSKLDGTYVKPVDPTPTPDPTPDPEPTDPTEPSEDPTESATDPQPTETEPSEPTTDPSVPETDPSEPATDPSVPETDPSEPATDPSVPETDPSEPAEEPSSPETDPQE